MKWNQTKCNQLKSRLAKAGKSKFQLSIAMDVDYQTLVHWTRGRREVPDNLDDRINIAMQRMQ